MKPSGSGPVYRKSGRRLSQLGLNSRSDSQRADAQRSPTRPRSSTTWSTPDVVSSRLTARPAWPAPMTTTGMPDIVSPRRDVDDDVGSVGQDVVDGRPAPGLLDQLRELLRGRVAVDREAHPDLPVSVPDAVVQPEDAQQVDVALDGRLDPVQGDAAGCGDVGQPRGEAGGDGVQQEFHRRDALVRSEEHTSEL